MPQHRESEAFAVASITWQQALPVRHQVLWPDMPVEHCRINGDENAFHFGIAVSSQLACVASVYIEPMRPSTRLPDGQNLTDGNHPVGARLRKFATLPAFQGQGLGSTMLAHIRDQLRQQSVSYLWFDARESAIPFYRKQGFDTRGERFFKHDIAYYKMYAAL